MAERALDSRRIADRKLQTQCHHPQAYLADVITKIVNGHPNSRIDELLPWAYSTQRWLKDVA